MPSLITKYPPIAEPIIKNATPARYTEDGLSNPSGKTPVPPLIFVLVVLVSMPLLKSQKSFSKSTLACSAITPANVNTASRISMDEYCHQLSARATGHCNYRCKQKPYPDHPEPYGQHQVLGLFFSIIFMSLRFYTVCLYRNSV